MSKGRIFSLLGILGIVVTFIVTATEISSNDPLRPIFVVIGILLSIVIVALGEILNFLEKKHNN